MAEIHQEMSELLDKQVNAQKENNTSGFYFRCAMKMKQRNKETKKQEEKNDAHVKILFMEGSPL